MNERLVTENQCITLTGEMANRGLVLKLKLRHCSAD